MTVSDATLGSSQQGVDTVPARPNPVNKAPTAAGSLPRCCDYGLKVIESLEERLPRIEGRTALVSCHPAKVVRARPIEIRCRSTRDGGTATPGNRQETPSHWALEAVPTSCPHVVGTVWADCRIAQNRRASKARQRERNGTRITIEMRRRRDLNPRNPCGFSTLAGWCTRPDYATSPGCLAIIAGSRRQPRAGEPQPLNPTEQV